MRVLTPKVGRAAGLLVLAAAVGVLAGCYERVIRAKGIGAEGMNVQKPYASSTAVENALMGSPQDPGSTRRIKSPLEKQSK